MPLRPASLALALAGLLLIAALVVARRDARRSGAAGPTWKRRLIAAGFGLLASLGFGAAAAAGEEPPAAERAGDALEARPEWKRLQSVVKEAEAIASGSRGDYPFDEEGRKKLDDEFAAAPRLLEAAVSAGLVDRAEADLFARRLGDLQGRVSRFRAVEHRRATCYAPMMPANPVRESAERLSDRLPILRRLVDAKALHPRVLEKLLESVAADREELAREKNPSPEQRKLLKDVTAQLDKLKARLPPR